MKTDSRRGKVVVSHQNSKMKELSVRRLYVLEQEANGVFFQERSDMVMTFLTEGQSGSVVLYFL